MTPPTRVGVVVVNYNGGDLTVRCIESVLALDWPPTDLRVVLVDNASTDGVVEHARRTWGGSVEIVESERNLGFAGGCNAAFERLDDVTCVALVNNDAVVDPGWLAPLVDALVADERTGAATGKVLLEGDYVDVEVVSDTAPRGRLDSRQVGVRVSGVRVGDDDVSGRAHFVSGFWGPELGRTGPFQWTRGQGLIRVPCAGGTGAVRLDADRDVTVHLRSGEASTTHRVGRTPEWFGVDLAGVPHAIVNNTGLVLHADGYVTDRGFLEPDSGQYDARTEVFGWSGAGVVLARRYLDAVGPFADDFFLYCEDVDLSWRGRNEGWRYVYVPDAVMHHRHSATARAGSPFADILAERNRLLTLVRNGPGRLALGAVVRFALITLSYARRDVIAPLARGQRPEPARVLRRLRALTGFAGHLGPALADRRRLRARRRTSDADVLRWAEPDGMPDVA